jgi:hypothetical protein
MSNRIPRRAVFLLGLPASNLFSQQATPAWFPTEDPALVKEMVGVSHRDPKRVRELLTHNPALVRAAIDWGFGDWESALGAASHVGNREIAELLIEHGANPTIFSAAMLGQEDAVRGIVKSSPGIQRQLGPHGITLLSHAKAGGEQAKGVLQYLTSLGDADKGLPIQQPTKERRDSIVGTYVFGPGAQDQFVIDEVRERLGIMRPGSTGRIFLHNSEGNNFYPSGAPWAKIIFEEEGGKITALTLGNLKARRR